MWQRTAIVVVLGLVWAPRAEACDEEIRYTELLILDLNWVSFDVAMGRVLATGNRTRHDQQRASRELPGGGQETLAVTCDHGCISLHYAYRAPLQQLVIRVVHRDRVEITSTAGDATAPTRRVIYVQEPAGNVSLTLEEAGQAAHHCEAPSLWHLELADADICRAHLNALLRILRSDWQIDTEVAAIRATLLATEPARATTSRQEVAHLVAELAADDFHVRRSAVRELHARGRGVLGFLQDLDPATLDAEQRLRVQEIQASIVANYEDTPARVAAWLVNDRAAWLALLNDEQPQHRVCAERHLARLCNRPIDFDPAGPAETRSAQVAQLRAELLRR